jgi:4-diphosphocytidyl-2-C-methyl-D-erythritol kinase
MLLIPAYAKINLALSVLGRRDDGFHDIDSVAVTIDWHDLVGISLAAAGTTAIRLRVTGAAQHVPYGPDNLAARAAAAVAMQAGPLSVDLWLDKRIPSRAGLGGGSADAAAVLSGMARILRDGIDGRDAPDAAALAKIAAALGSDVPLLLAGGAQRVRGRGEKLTALAGPSMHLAVAIAAASETAAAYAASRAADRGGADRIATVAEALDGGRRPDEQHLGSALEAPAGRANHQLRDRLGALRDAVPEVGWHLTGSGGAAFAIARDRADALRLAASAGAAGFVARACRTVVPAPPAETPAR